MNETTALFAFLEQIISLRITARSIKKEDPTYKGIGIVKVTSESCGIVQFDEMGTATLSGVDSETKFRNSLRWSRTDNNSFILQHLRYDSPVSLGSLHYANGYWDMQQPHYCEADCYLGRVRVEANSTLHLSWQVSGPKKAQVIEIEYATELPLSGI